MLVGGTQIKAQALIFPKGMQIKDLQLKFTDGSSWFRHFKGLHGLHYMKAHGEAKSMGRQTLPQPKNGL